MGRSTTGFATAMWARPARTLRSGTWSASPSALETAIKKVWQNTHRTLTITALSAGPIKATAISATSATLSVSVSGGSGSPTIAWYRSKDLTYTDGSSTLVAGATSATLGVTGLTSGDLWLYRCVIVNGGTTLTRDYFLLVPASNQTITEVTAGWVASNGGSDGPWQLAGPNKYFWLTTDLAALHTALIPVGNNVTVNLNGYTVGYDNAPAIDVVNGDFSDGAENTIPGWDVTNAPDAQVVNNIFALPPSPAADGQKCVEFHSITSPESMLSAPITIPTLAREYCAICTVKMYNDTGLSQNWSSAKLDVVDAADLSTVYSTQTISETRARSHRIKFVPSNSNPVRLKLTVTPGVGGDTFRVSDFRLCYSRDYGIWNTKDHGAGSDVPMQLLAYRNDGYGTVLNGTVTQGTASSYAGHGAYHGSVLHAWNYYGVTFNVSAADGSGIVLANTPGAPNAGEHCTVDHCTLNFTCTLIGQHIGQVDAAINGSGSTGIVVSNNTINECPHYGVYFTNTATITDNTICPRNCIGDAYGISCFGSNGFTISGNTILATDSRHGGRGIMTDSNVLNGTISGNYVDVHEFPFAEYADQTLGIAQCNTVTTAYRNRPDGGSGGGGTYNNVSVHDNTFIARAGVGFMQKASACRISCSSFTSGSQVSPANCNWYNNTLKGITDIATDDAYHYAYALSLEDVLPADNGFVLYNNTLESNDISLQIGTPDGSTRATGVLLHDCTWKKSSEGAVKTYKSISAGYWHSTCSNIKLINRSFATGTTENWVWVGDGLKTIGTGWMLSVTANNHSGDPISGATVTVTDSHGTQVYSGITDGSGTASGIPVVTTDKSTTTGVSVTITDYVPHTVAVSTTEYGTVSNVVTLTAPASTGVVLPAESDSIDGDTTICGIRGTGMTSAQVQAAIEAALQGGVKLAADGLDSITADEPTTKPTNFREWLLWLVQRFRRASKTADAITVLTEAGATVTTQPVTSSGDNETLGAPS